MCVELVLNEHLLLSAPLTHKIISSGVGAQLLKPQFISHGLKIHARVIL